MVLTNFRMVDESGSGFFSYEQAYIDYYLSEISEKDSCVYKEDSSVEPRTGLGTGFQDELNGCVQEDELWDSNQVVQDFWSSTLDSKYKFLSRSVVAQSVERPSKVPPVWCSSTDVGSKHAAAALELGKNPSQGHVQVVECLKEWDFKCHESFIFLSTIS